MVNKALHSKLKIEQSTKTGVNSVLSNIKVPEMLKREWSSYCYIHKDFHAQIHDYSLAWLGIDISVYVALYL